MSRRLERESPKRTHQRSAVCYASWVPRRITTTTMTGATIVTAFRPHARGAPPDDRPRPSIPDKSYRHNRRSCAIARPSSPRPPARARTSTGRASASTPGASSRPTGPRRLFGSAGVSSRRSSCRPAPGRPQSRAAMSCSSRLRGSSFSTGSFIYMRGRERGG